VLFYKKERKETMIIKNHDILVRRAKEHMMLDHIAQRTYGDIHFLQNGVIEPIKWRGCAISCLATETTIEGLKNQEDLNFDAIKIEELDNGKTEFSVNLQSHRLREMLHDKFGMCFKLIYMAECIFEGSDEDYAREWPLAFAEALCDGKYITDEDIDFFWSNNVLPEIDQYYNERHIPKEFNPDKPDSDDNVWSVDDYFEFFDETIGEEFITFLMGISVNQPEIVGVA